MSRFGRASRWIGATSWPLRVSLAALALSGPALATDWSLRFGASQSLTVDDNLDLTETNRDAGLMSSTAVDLNLLGTGKTYKMGFTPRVSVSRTFFSEEPDDWSYFPSGTLLLSKWTKLTTYDLVASHSRSEASSNELVEGLITEDEGEQLNYAVTGTITHKVNERNSLIWSNAASLVDYTLPSDDLVPSLTATSTGTWQHEFTELVSSSLVGSAQYYNPDSDTVEGRLLYRATAGMNARLTKRLSVAGAVGAVILDPDGDDTVVDLIYNASADYKLKNTGYSFSFGRDLSPSQDGSLNDRFSARLAVSHAINDLTTLGAFASYSMQTDSDDEESSAFTISPSLSYRLSEDWSSSISYRFIETRDDVETAHSNAVTLSLSYGTFLLP
ncbi:MAG: porin family protein [Hyphomicrobiales bacterium]|nr:porin family protein [Hyphomicrobiales bacterium]